MSNEIKETNHAPKTGYSETKGTGVLSTLIFAVAVVVLMILLAHFKG